MSTAPAQVYAFDNDSEQATAHHDALANLLDANTIAKITGLLDLSGRRCLEVAAGGGSIALWLAEQVGDGGAVVATDIKPQHITEHPRLTVLEHDITSDPLPGRFDLIHARLLLNHLPERREIVHRLASALRPGGVLLTEDLDPTPAAYFAAVAPTPEALALFQRFWELHLQVLASHGNDRTWPRRAYAAYREEGLVDVRIQVWGESWPGGSPGTQLIRAGTAQIRSELVALGMSDTEVDEVRALLLDPRFVLHGHNLYSISGRRPIANGN